MSNFTKYVLVPFERYRKFQDTFHKDHALDKTSSKTTLISKPSVSSEPVVKENKLSEASPITSDPITTEVPEPSEDSKTTDTTDTLPPPPGIPKIQETRKVPWFTLD